MSQYLQFPIPIVLSKMLVKRRSHKSFKKSSFPFISVFLRSFFFFYQGFLHRHWRFTGQLVKGGNHLLFYSTTSTRSRALRHLFATLQVRWLSRIFNCNACVYQTTTRWDLPPYQITIWVIDWWYNVWLFTWWIDTRSLLQRFDIGNPYSHRLSPLYYKRTD